MASTSSNQGAHLPPPEPAAKKKGLLDILLYGIILSIHYPLKLTTYIYNTSMILIEAAIWIPLEILGRVYRIVQATLVFIRWKTKIVLSYAFGLLLLSILVPYKLIVYSYNRLLKILDRILGYFKKRKNKSSHNHTRASIDGKPRRENQQKIEHEEKKDNILSIVTSNIRGILNTARKRISLMMVHIKEIGMDYYDIVKTEVQIYLSLLQYVFIQLSKQLEKSPWLSPILEWVLNVVQFANNKTQPRISGHHQNDHKCSSETNESLKVQILKLQEELRKLRGTSPDHERVQCDKQIHDLEKQLSKMTQYYNKQNEKLQSEIQIERQEYMEKIKRLTEELSAARSDKEKHNEEQMKKFNQDRSKYLDDLDNLLEKTAHLRRELEKYEDSQFDQVNHTEAEVSDPEDSSDPYVTDTLDKITNINTLMQGLQKRVKEFVGTKNDGEYLNLMSDIIQSIIELNKVDPKTHRIIKKKRANVENSAREILSEAKSKC